METAVTQAAVEAEPATVLVSAGYLWWIILFEIIALAVATPIIIVSVVKAKNRRRAAQAAAEAERWICAGCGAEMHGDQFCTECGAPRPEEQACPQCGYTPDKGARVKFCPKCGSKM